MAEQKKPATRTRKPRKTAAKAKPETVKSTTQSETVQTKPAEPVKEAETPESRKLKNRRRREVEAQLQRDKKEFERIKERVLAGEREIAVLK